MKSKYNLLGVQASCLCLLFCILVFLCCCCKAEMIDIDIKDYPTYFSNNVWKAIKKAHSSLSVRGDIGKIVGVLDAQVEYIGGLQNRKHDSFQQKIDKIYNEEYDQTSKLSNPLHGTAVASLIAANPGKYTCYNVASFSSKSCNDNPEQMVVAGIVKNLNITSMWIPNLQSMNIDAIDNFISVFVNEVLKHDPLSKLPRAQRRKYEERHGRKLATQIILNLSFGPQKLSVLKQSINDYIDDENKMAHKNIMKSWVGNFIDNNSWQPASSNVVQIQEWNRVKRQIQLVQREYDRNSKVMQNELEEILGRFDYNIIERGSVLFVIVAGNEKTELSTNEEVFSGNIGAQVSIKVAAGCGSDYAKLCTWSNFGRDVVDILAPGENMPVMVSIDGSAKATYVDGTSFSAPLITGLTALLIQCKPYLTVAEIKEKIFEKARIKDNLKQKIKQGKILDVEGIIDYFCQDDVDMYSTPPDENLEPDEL